MSKRIVIIGGGLAGLAAATALARRGLRVTLLESRPRLGGRAGSFLDRATGTRIDNCQHVSLGCCTNFQKFCDTLGLARFFRRERRLNFVGPDGAIDALTAGFLPAPLHLWAGFRRLSYLSRKDKRSLSRGLRELARTDPAIREGESFAEWLAAQRQTPAAIERFWRVVLVSALSETLDRIDVASARKVFVDAFLANRRGWEVLIPTVPLDDLYGGLLSDWLTAGEVSIRLGCGVERLLVEDDRVAAVLLRGDERLEGDEFILAVPHHRVASLLPDPLQTHPQVAGLSRLETAPISSLHLWFDRPFTDLPHAVFIDRLSQWLFNRSILQGDRRVVRGSPDPRVVRGSPDPGVVRGSPDPRVVRGSPDPARESDRRSPACRSPGDLRSAAWHGPETVSQQESNSNLPDAHLFYYQIVISASRNLSDLSQQQVIDAVVGELADVWPATREANLVHARMVTEHKAVFSVLPGADAFRPPQQSSVANLQWAGDWTQTGWPSTMEGAVRSGFLAAENVLARLGAVESLLAPDLPVAPLSKLLLGL